MSTMLFFRLVKTYVVFLVIGLVLKKPLSYIIANKQRYNFERIME